MTAVALLLCLTSLAPPTIAPPRVALLHSGYGEFRHRDDYDAKLRGLGWPAEKVQNTAFAAFTPRLAEFDLLLGTALYNYGDPQDLLARRAEVVRWLEQGGAMVLTDANYTDHVRWLGALGAGYEADIAPCAKGGQAVELPEPGHTLLNWPYPIKPAATWAHLKLGSQWRQLARCADGSTVLAVASVGRGFILLSSAWPLTDHALSNIWEYLRLRRAGVDGLTVTGLDQIGPGDCRAVVTPTTTDRAAVPVIWTVEQPDGRQVVTRGEARGALTLTARLSQRGRHQTWLTVGADRPYVSAPTEVVVPEAVEPRLIAPTYRDYLPLGLPSPHVVVGLTAWPYGERLDGAQTTVSLVQAGREVARTQLASPLKQAEQRQVTLAAGKLAAGSVEVRVNTRRAGKDLGTRTFTLRVLPAAKPQVLLDEHRRLTVDGLPFFPIGIYHVPDEALAEARAMGFNCHQAWGGPLAVSRRSLDAGAKAGMKVILEMSGFLRGKYDPDQLRAVVRELKTHPALLAWYTVDEPAGEQHAWCLDAYRICREEDPNHPVFLVSCDPSQFAGYTPTTDILAIDPYPIDNAPVSMVASWCRTAMAAVGQGKPYWLIPQLQNLTAYTDPTKGRGPTPAEEWCMVVQGLIHDAKGIVYYPWNDGTNGLTHEPALQRELPAINRLLATIGPDLAAAERQPLDTGNADLLAARYGQWLLATNTGGQPLKLTLPVGAWHSVRDDRTMRGELTLAPLEVVVARAAR